MVATRGRSTWMQAKTLRRKSKLAPKPTSKVTEMLELLIGTTVIAHIAVPTLWLTALLLLKNIVLIIANITTINTYKGNSSTAFSSYLRVALICKLNRKPQGLSPKPQALN